MLAWPIVQQIRQQALCNVLVGPTVLEAEPSMTWSSMGDACPFGDADSPMILLEAVEPDQRLEVLQRASTCQHWVVITSKKPQAPEVQRALEEMGAKHPLLQPTSPKVYAKK